MGREKQFRLLGLESFGGLQISIGLSQVLFLLISLGPKPIWFDKSWRQLDHNRTISITWS
jgi:hypothetical protein